MRVYGIDFTSAPGPRRPMACAACSLDGATLHVDALVDFPSFEVFENFLGSTGPWVAGLDFPFGQPRALREALGWPTEWSGYVGEVAALDLDRFERLIGEFRDARPAGRKHPRRRADTLAGARSPLMLHGVPVGRMFFRGAPRLLRAGVAVPPCHHGDRSRVALEAYPALAARKAIGRRPYKRARAGAAADGARETARADLVAALGAPDGLGRAYGLTLRLPPPLAEELAGDPGGDRLDAVLCAVQAAWAWRHRDGGYGIPTGVDAAEGWIVDPETAGTVPG